MQTFCVQWCYLVTARRSGGKCCCGGQRFAKICAETWKPCVRRMWLWCAGRAACQPPGRCSRASQLCLQSAPPPCHASTNPALIKTLNGQLCAVLHIIPSLSGQPSNIILWSGRYSRARGQSSAFSLLQNIMAQTQSEALMWGPEVTFWSPFRRKACPIRQTAFPSRKEHFFGLHDNIRYLKLS